MKAPPAGKIIAGDDFAARILDSLFGGFEIVGLLG